MVLLFFRRAGWRARWHEGDKGGQGGHEGGIRRARGHPVNRKGGCGEKKKERNEARAKERERETVRD